jgi:hypothetical protein
VVNVLEDPFSSGNPWTTFTAVLSGVMQRTTSCHTPGLIKTVPLLGEVIAFLRMTVMFAIPSLVLK